MNLDKIRRAAGEIARPLRVSGPLGSAHHSCPLSNCDWQITVQRPSIHVAADLENALRAHYESHDVSDFLQEIQETASKARQAERERITSWLLLEAAHAEAGAEGRRFVQGGAYALKEAARDIIEGDDTVPGEEDE